ncbi:unnamed protein product [Didymodactylos carnosus]|uniref:Uncharacterized protein n=1 Tax=Didymodactylos carnosus TaxID=1234261 RepID=A0A815N885_9BILA|nr:unnamed protein product [Didymodactylos carnosus]CAF1617378.1 unnamed protein product [Didymodactylos carnosus]CAF4313294.1 unnamed protein product [Didymodactylos carnosus]CAF4434777.1 unnamed protein product [Didymodactylos carnosus]
MFNDLVLDDKLSTKRRIYVNNTDYDYDCDDDEIEYVVEEKLRPVKYVQRPIRRAVYVLEDDEPPQQPQPSPRPQSKTILRQNAKPVTIRRYTIRTLVDNPVPPAPAKIQSNDHTYVRAMDIILVNRAKRGWKLPKPKREVPIGTFK